MSEHYEPPPGPPPRASAQSQEQDRSQLQPGAQSAGRTRYEPPPGPPPGQSKKRNLAPQDAQSKTPNSDDQEPPPYDPWLAVPDNALLPPPPSIREERSPTANATWDDAARGHAWCKQNPLWRPRPLSRQALSRISDGDISLTIPPKSKHIRLSQSTPGKTRVRTDPKLTDTLLLSDLPLFTASTGRPSTVYFELHVISIGQHSRSFLRSSETDSGIAIGYLAPPYPFWRLPGWHRASLAVHGDDGRRYIDNSFGGMEFTSPFKKNDAVGIGMIFSPPAYGSAKNQCEIFFTRDGKKQGGWNLHEEKDQEQDDGDVLGLEGTHDLLVAVGCFGAVEFEVRFRREDWSFKPKS